MKEGRYIMLDVKDLYKESYIGKEITVSGWIKSHRKQAHFGFIDLSDGTCFKNLQVVNNLFNFVFAGLAQENIQHGRNNAQRGQCYQYYFRYGFGAGKAVLSPVSRLFGAGFLRFSFHNANSSHKIYYTTTLSCLQYQFNTLL